MALRCCEPTADRDKIARLFACDCAERTLPIFEKKYPEDKRPRQAIEAARKFANGEATQKELDAAWAVAGDAVWDAVWDAAWDVAWDAARDATWDATWDAERQWQTQHLKDSLAPLP